MQCMQSPTRLGLLHAGWAVLVGAVLLAGGTTAQSNIVCHVEVQLSAPSQNDGNSFACPIKMVGGVVLLTMAETMWVARRRHLFYQQRALQTLFNDGSNNLVPSYVVDVYNGNYVGVESFYGWDSADATTSTIKGYVTQVWTLGVT